ncbi:hypothetical protein FOA43_004410 [Brettanomyces nanus]|uniref:RNA lariat debranching enzyme n=1 Tax=Eeniella nana TaxID=13502 RepID=A0A875SAA8_EENNA|nr:uncharacterized protein FOA43_004410 [Brettanomyces nanus]QPG77015.1 hypothetical protein FOA43_004410 [Brettanomyces nanus]
MRIAIEGCCHGNLDQIYSSIKNKDVELLIACGDFQSLRNEADMQCISVPIKYRSMGDFQAYYTGAKKAPVFTIFIGGNHEASNYLEELKYGGFVAPNIYYLGRSGAVWYKGLRIIGWSGIYYSRDFMNIRRDEALPYNRWAIRMVYHYRKDDYMKLRLLNECNDSIVVSHDWPEGIYRWGSLNYLLKKKPFFKKDIEKGELGSPMNRELLEHLRPKYWMAAHLHVGYKVTVDWNKKRQITKVDNKDEIDLDLDLSEEDQDAEKESKPIASVHDTTFLALDKCLPRRHYLEILDVPLTNDKHRSAITESPLYFDLEYISLMQSVEKHKSELDSLEYQEILFPEAEYRDKILAESHQL